MPFAGALYCLLFASVIAIVMFIFAGREFGDEKYAVGMFPIIVGIFCTFVALVLAAYLANGNAAELNELNVGQTYCTAWSGARDGKNLYLIHNADKNSDYFVRASKIKELPSGCFLQKANGDIMPVNPAGK